MVVNCCIVKFTSFQRDGRRCYEYFFACVKRNKMDSELLTCLLKFIEYFPDYLSALSRTLSRFFGQPLSKQLYIPEGISDPKHYSMSVAFLTVICDRSQDVVLGARIIQAARKFLFDLFLILFFVDSMLD